MTSLAQTRWRAVLFRLLGFAALWWVLAEGELYRFWFGAVVAAAAATASLRVWPPRRLRGRWRALLEFVPYFLLNSFLGAVDVARRAFAPTLPLQPAVCEFRVQLQGAAARALLAWTLSLFPGTASVRLDGERLEVHVLAPGFLSQSQLGRLETRIADLLGETPPRAETEES